MLSFALSLLTLSTEAQAGIYWGYVCEVTYEPAASWGSRGDHGGFDLSLYAEPDCAGSYRGTIDFPSANHFLPGLPDFHYEPDALFVLLEEANRAAENDTYVSFATYDSGWTSIATDVIFRHQ